MGLSGLSGWNLLPESSEALHKAVSKIVRKASFDIQHEAMRNHPYQNQTGFLQGSIYVVTKGASTYDQAAEAQSNNPQAELLPEVEQPPDDQTAYVAVGANYGIYVEMGTVNMPAFPYLVPAAELIRPQYLAAMKSLEGPILSFLGGGGTVDVSADEEPF